MDLRHLRSFAAIVNAGGFARAAARLNLSQPVLSRQIQALEGSLDVRLFDRIGRRARYGYPGRQLTLRAPRLARPKETTASGAMLAPRARETRRARMGGSA